MIHAKPFVTHNWERLRKISLAPVREGREYEVICNFGVGFSFIFNGPALELKSFFLEVVDAMEEGCNKVIDWPQMIGEYVESLEELCLVLNNKPIVVHRRENYGKKVS